MYSSFKYGISKLKRFFVSIIEPVFYSINYF